MGADLTPISSAEFGPSARRPADTVLANDRLGQLGVPPLPPIEDALSAYLREKGHLPER